MTVQTLRLPTTDSTNLHARRMYEAGERGPLWVVAERQSAGRGRLGRQWESGRGNLYASALVPPPRSEPPTALTFAAALAARDAVAAHVAGEARDNVRLKWPNDVLLGGRKVAGILLESPGGAVVAGIGINVAHHPEATRWPATHLGGGVGVDAVLGTLQARFEHWRAVLDRDGFAPVRAAWTDAAWGLGSEVVVETGNRRIVGTARGLDASGALRIDTPTGAETVSAGEVAWRARTG